jgi:hypothetical protein
MMKKRNNRVKVIGNKGNVSQHSCKGGGDDSSYKEPLGIR